MDLMSITVLYKVFYFILHYISTIFEFIEDIYIKLRIKLIGICHEFIPVNKNKKFVKFEKIPKHLTVLLGTEEPSPKDLANLILWCMSAHITFISFYDYAGTLKKHQDKLHSVVEEKKGASDHVIWHNNPDCVHKNGYIGRKIHVKVLSGNDGRKSVVDLIKNITLSGETNVNLENLDAGFKKQFEFPDPDLGVCCGKTFSLYGYPPWQIRVTEFFKISSHHHITFDIFIKLLHSYNKCEQRFGK